MCILKIILSYLYYKILLLYRYYLFLIFVATPYLLQYTDFVQEVIKYKLYTVFFFIESSVKGVSKTI